MLADGFTWDLASDLGQLFEFHFMVNAYRAGTIVAVVAALIGWFLVLRQQSFVGHTLAVISFPGASGAILIGISAAWGYFGFCVAGALVIGAVRRARPGEYGEESARSLLNLWLASGEDAQTLARNAMLIGCLRELRCPLVTDTLS